MRVVYLLIPTSNHNLSKCLMCCHLLYIFWFLHQTTTLSIYLTIVSALYIFWFLHQTTTHFASTVAVGGCISFDSYIKPQPRWDCLHIPQVVYLLIPTSNHNLRNLSKGADGVVYLLIPTSNHNSHLSTDPSLTLYIFWFLHQTTTSSLVLSNSI